jgi:outer membrane lipopolysaccharide assembly protein LptE/RlpB
MKSKMLFFLIAGLFLTACGYELPKMANSADNSTNSALQANQNAKNQSNQMNAGQVNNATTSQTNGGNSGEKLILNGNSESATHACNGREVEVKETATANTYTLTGECKKITVDGVSNTINVEKVGEISVTGVSNKVTYGEGISGKKPKISKSGTSTFVESRAEAEKKASATK